MPADTIAAMSEHEVPEAEMLPGLRAAVDDARAKAIAVGRARADLYARSLGMRVVRIVAVNESGSFSPPPRPVMMEARMAAAPQTKIEPGEQNLQVSVQMTFELQ